jgi:cytoskeletal protein CcmA (bactofilin family)
VSTRTKSVPCPKCNKALKVEDITVKSYLPVNDLQTCGRITIAKNGRVVAKVIRSGDGIDCEGTLEGALETDGPIVLGDKASWKGKSLMCKSIAIAEGAKLVGYMKIPWQRPETDPRDRSSPTQPSPSSSSSTP